MAIGPVTLFVSPLAFLLAPSVSSWLDATETQTHWLLFGLAVPISSVALYRGYLREPNLLTVSTGVLGLILMLLAVLHLLGEELIVLTTLGVVLVMVAHIRNLHVGHDHAGKLALNPHPSALWRSL